MLSALTWSPLWQPDTGAVLAAQWISGALQEWSDLYPSQAVAGKLSNYTLTAVTMRWPPYAIVRESSRYGTAKQPTL